jgi:hypothetical protein
MPAVTTAPFTCVVIRVHDGDGPLWCRSGQKIRVAGIQAPDFTSAEPCRRPDRRRANYTCDDQAAARSQQIVSRLVLGKRLTCLPMGGVTSVWLPAVRCRMGGRYHALPSRPERPCGGIGTGGSMAWASADDDGAWQPTCKVPDMYLERSRSAGRRLGGRPVGDAAARHPGRSALRPGGGLLATHLPVIRRGGDRDVAASNARALNSQGSPNEAKQRNTSHERIPGRGRRAGSWRSCRGKPIPRRRWHSVSSPRMVSRLVGVARALRPRLRDETGPPPLINVTSGRQRWYHYLWRPTK